MIGLIFFVAFVCLGFIGIATIQDTWVILSCFAIASIWYAGWALSTIWAKLKEIQEGLYAEFAVRCGLVPDKEKEVEE